MSKKEQLTYQAVIKAINELKANGHIPSVLNLMLLDRLEKDENIPTPSSIKQGEVPISASPDVTAPALLPI